MLHLDMKTQIWNQLDVLATSWSRLDDGDEPGEIYTLTRWYPHSYICLDIPILHTLIKTRAQKDLSRDRIFQGRTKGTKKTG